MIVTMFSSIKSADIIRITEQLKKIMHTHPEVNVVIHDDHISIVDPHDDHLLSYIKRNKKAT